jgi:hypothetical protein
MNLMNRPRLRWVPISLRRMKSPSEMMPTSFPASTTGSPLTCRCNMVFAASTTVVSGLTVMTGRVMIWCARIECLRRFQIEADILQVISAGAR